MTIITLKSKSLNNICLLQEDFLKWKGSLFFRFITALVDESKDIKHFGECKTNLRVCRSDGGVFIMCLYFKLLDSSYDFMVFVNVFRLLSASGYFTCYFALKNIQKLIAASPTCNVS